LKIEENRRIANFKSLVTLTLDRVIRHTVVHHSSTSTYIPNFIGIGKKLLWTDKRMYGRTSETHIIRSTLRSRPKNGLPTVSFNLIVLVTCNVTLSVQLARMVLPRHCGKKL